MDIRIKHSKTARSLFLQCIWAGIALLIAGCASGGSGPKPTATLDEVIAKESGSQQEIREINTKLFASVSAAPQPKDYLLGEGDLIQIDVFEAQELKTETRVGARGFVTLPLIGPVELKGLTSREAEQKIEDLYRRKYLQNPHVSVFVKEQVSGKITLLGALNKPGTYSYLTRQHLLDVLAMGEGLSDKAGRTVQVRRTEENSPQPITYMVDLDALIKNGQSEMNLEIKGGDVVYVPEAGMVYVDGAVRKPGNYPIKTAMSLPEAIAAAGGFSTTADEGNIKLVRSNENGNREVVQLSIKDLRQDTKENLEVKDRDVIFVETSKVDALLYGLRLNIGGGIFGVGYQPPPQ
ncbi:polysaccharide biosynthesis/export family protein [Desulforhabdus amnigena]|jgi:polysaccharide export outer membrane protein|uniref:Polysaccharide export protein n=1 Tax=Desulforhabdus amnigena TaxID=40218 RepID=A0A9W6FX39_9BACT|nr:polysaccharide biosynthesis/export family protein [Desulforhabdus amnigena]NLJ28033.1 hypothetical protein [Deltaproteobacteria bacterium]GLI36423.1 hypothetical protein DAMNIGENAA_38560 [Desulforhabdus amnigena]